MVTSGKYAYLTALHDVANIDCVVVVFNHASMPSSTGEISDTNRNCYFLPLPQLRVRSAAFLPLR